MVSGLDSTVTDEASASPTIGEMATCIYGVFGIPSGRITIAADSFFSIVFWCKRRFQEPFG